MRELAKTEIDGITYQTVQFEVKKSLRVITKVARKLGKPMVELLTKMGGKKLSDFLEEDVGKMGPALAGVLQDLGDDEVYDLSKDICSDVIATQSGTTVGGQLIEQKFDMHFKGPGGLMRLIKVCKWALEVNYGDFFSAVTELSGNSDQVVSGPKTSTRVR